MHNCWTPPSQLALIKRFLILSMIIGMMNVNKAALALKEPKFTAGSTMGTLAVPSTRPKSSSNDNWNEDSDEELFYPVVESEEERVPSVPSSFSAAENPAKIQPASPRPSFALVKAVEQVFRDAGYSREEMLRMLTNQSLFAPNKVVVGTTEGNLVVENDDHALALYKERVRGILGTKRGNPDEINTEIRELMRVITDTEFDDFREVFLRMIQPLRQDFPNNRTLLVAMIQAAMQQWGVNYTRLPPPFGTAPPNQLPPLPEDMKRELYNLSQLLTKDLKQALISILEKDQKKGKQQVEMELATVEDREGGLILIANGNNVGEVANAGKTKMDSSSTEIHSRALRVARHEEHGGDQEFSISQDIQLDTPQEDAGNDDSFQIDEMINPERLERIILAERAQRQADSRTDRLHKKHLHAISRHKRI